MLSATSDPTLLDRKLVSTAEGALPLHTRINVLQARGWEAGLITESYTCLAADGKAVVMYKILYDNGKEQETDLSNKDSKLMTLKDVLDTPRSQRKAEARGAAAPPNPSAPTVGVTNIPSPSRLGDLKVGELRKMCSDLGLETKGVKKELIETQPCPCRSRGDAHGQHASAPLQPQLMTSASSRRRKKCMHSRTRLAALQKQLEKERASASNEAKLSRP